MKGPQGVELDDLVDGMVAVQQFRPGVVRLVVCGQGEPELEIVRRPDGTMVAVAGEKSARRTCFTNSVPWTTLPWHRQTLHTTPKCTVLPRSSPSGTAGREPGISRAKTILGCRDWTSPGRRLPPSSSTGIPAEWDSVAGAICSHWKSISRRPFRRCWIRRSPDSLAAYPRINFWSEYRCQTLMSL